MKKSGPRKHDEPKISESRTRVLEIATIRVAQVASMFLRLLMDGRAAFGTKKLKGRYSAIASNA
jgi:hypothetical protein